MLPKFYLKREQTTTLYAKEVTSPYIEFHFHSHIELLAVLEGQIEVTVNDRQQLLQPGQIAVALSHDAHQFRSPTPSRAISIVIPTDMCAEFISAIGDRKTMSPFLTNEVLFQTVCDCFSKMEASTNTICQKGHLYVLLGTLLACMQLEQRQDLPDPQLYSHLLQYINNHYTQDISLRTISTALGYNPSYLSRIFNNSFYTSIPKYITLLRLRHAVLMMQDPKKSITDCAYESGFHSLRTFYRVFQEEFHCSPREYRNK